MLRLLGPDGVNQRIAEIQAKLDRLNPPVRQGATFYNEFGEQLNGAIGKNGFAPFNPVGNSNTVTTPVGPELRAMIDQASARWNLPEGLLDALVSAESGYNPMAVSSANAQGLTQLMPATARGLGITDPFNPEQNLMGGARYLRSMLDRFGGDVRSALAAYNAGPNRVKDTSRPWPAETVAYVNRVLGKFEAGRAG